MKFKKILFVLLVFVYFWPNAVKAITKEDMFPMDLKKVLTIPMPEGYKYFQGMTITKNEIVVAAVKADDSLTSLLVFDKKTLKQNVAKTKTLNLGHANDMIYEEDKNEIYVINGSKINVLNADTLEEKTSISLPITAVAGSYDKDKHVFYLKGNNTTYVYDSNLQELRNFEVDCSLGHQGMSFYKSNVIYTFAAVSQNQENLDISAGAIYIYSQNGEFVKAYSIAPSYGELEALEFSKDQIPYMLYNTPDGKGAIYIPQVDELAISIEVKDETKDLEIYASLSDKEGNIGTAHIKDGKYLFSPIYYIEPGIYEYQVARNHVEKVRNAIEEVIHATVTIQYDFLSNKLEGKTTYDKKAFELLEKTEEVLPSDSETIDTTLPNMNSSNEVSKEETVENPQTGSNFPFYIIPVFLGIVTGVFLYKKKIFFKL